MKNYFKKIGIMFVMSLILILGCSVSAFAEDTTQTIKINNTTLNFNKIIYADSTKGNDTTGDGTLQNPYQTFNVAYSKITSANNEAIVLGEGQYTVSVDDSTLKVMDIVGQGRNTTLLFSHTLRRLNGSDGVMYIINNIKFHDLVFTTASNIGGYNIFMTQSNYFYNVAIAPKQTPSASYFCNSDSTLPTYFINSEDITSMGNLLRGYYNIMNSYGRFSFGYSTTSAKMKYTTSIITTTPSFDDNYNITSDGWKNTGTGTNPDETQANIGVYGGEFAWGESNSSNELITLDKSLMDLTEGDLQQLTAITTPAGVGVTWSTSDSSIATVDSTGKVTGVKEGQSTITATTSDGLTATCTVTVTKKAEQESISLNKSTTDLTTGNSETLIATTTSSAVNVTWSSSDTSVATVDSSGKVTAIGAGTASITATTTDGSNLSASCTINVTKEETTEPTESEYIVNTAYAKGDNTNNASGGVSIIFKGVAEAQLSVVKTADVSSVYVGDTFTYTIVVTNTSTKTAKAVVIKDSAPNHIEFTASGVTTTQGTLDSSSTSSNIIVNVGDIPALGTVTIKIPATVIL